MIPPDIHDEIMRRLARTEREEEVRIVLAIESGSRAWGFASPNSDYDVRFIYVRPADWYLSVDLEGERDVIEYEITDDIDLNGWDIRKGLRLFWKSNPAFIEWLQSPITYIESGGFASGARALLPDIYLSDRGMYHYRSMAMSNYRNYLQRDLVSLKKYLYVLRPLLSVRWIERYGSAAPMEFEKLLHLIDDQAELLADIMELLHSKRSGAEMAMAPPVESINRFIHGELERLESMKPERMHKPDTLLKLNRLFHSILREQPESTTVS